MSSPETGWWLFVLSLVGLFMFVQEVGGCWNKLSRCVQYARCLGRPVLLLFPLCTCVLKLMLDVCPGFFFFASLTRYRGDMAEIQPLCLSFLSPCVPAVTASACRRAKGMLGWGCPTLACIQNPGQSGAHTVGHLSCPLHWLVVVRCTLHKVIAQLYGLQTSNPLGSCSSNV